MNPTKYPTDQLISRPMDEKDMDDQGSVYQSSSSVILCKPDENVGYESVVWMASSVSWFGVGLFSNRSIRSKFSQTGIYSNRSVYTKIF